MEARAVAQRLPSEPLKIARAMFNDAIDAGLIRANPFANLRLEQSRGRKDLDALSEDEIRQLADAALAAFDDAFGLVMRAWVLVAGFTGVRPGEQRPWNGATSAPRSLWSTGPRPGRRAVASSCRGRRGQRWPICRAGLTRRGCSSLRPASGSARASCTATSTRCGLPTAGRSSTPMTCATPAGRT